MVSVKVLCPSIILIVCFFAHGTWKVMVQYSSCLFSSMRRVEWELAQKGRVESKMTFIFNHLAWSFPYFNQSHIFSGAKVRFEPARPEQHNGRLEWPRLSGDQDQSADKGNRSRGQLLPPGWSPWPDQPSFRHLRILRLGRHHQLQLLLRPGLRIHCGRQGPSGRSCTTHHCLVWWRDWLKKMHQCYGLWQHQTLWIFVSAQRKMSNLV